MLKEREFCKARDIVSIGVIIFLFNISLAKGQDYQPLVQPQISNYSTFSKNNKMEHPSRADDMEVLENSANEIIEKRTRNTKYYVDKSNPNKFIQLYSYGGSLNYLKDRKWLTADQKLQSKVKGIYIAEHQMEPVGFDIDKKIAFIKTVAGEINFNQWNLAGIQNGTETIIATPNWSNYSAGDDGLMIYNIFPGIDAEMKVKFGAIKTNFIIRENRFPDIEYFIFKDEFRSNQKLAKLIYGSDGQDQSTASFIVNGKSVVKIDKAIAYSETDASKSYRYLDYTIKNNLLSIMLDASYINNHLKVGNIIIDPLVESTATLAQNQITGSMNCGSGSNYCTYSFSVPTPAKVTFTKISFKWGFYANAPSGRNQGHFSINTGTCTSGNYGVENPSVNTGPGLVSTLGNFVSVTSLLSCLPSTTCISQEVPIELRFYNLYCGGNNECSDVYVRADEPLILKIEGHTLELESITAPQTICSGNSATISVEPQYGIKPYSYQWNDGETTSSIQVRPNTTTTYTVLVTDNCGSTINPSTIVNVNPLPSIEFITSNSPLCDGAQLRLSTPLVTDATYSWTGPNNFNSSSPAPIINNVTPDQSGIYTLRITVNGCTSFPVSTTVVIGRQAVPAITIYSSSKNICAGTPLTFNANILDGGNNPSYQWRKNGLNVGGNLNTITDTNFANGDVIDCVLTSSATCAPNPFVTSNNVTLIVKPVLIPKVDIESATSSFCAGKPAVFTANVINCGDSPTFNWQVNGNTVFTGSNSFTSSNLVTGDIVKCNVICDPAGCYTNSEIDSNPIDVEIGEIPEITLMADTTVSFGASFMIEASSIGPLANYQWSPSNYLSDNGILNPVVKPLKTTQYTLSATNDGNCSIVKIFKVTVLNKLDVPNTFSPNGDGVNDTWVIKGLEAYSDAIVNVYNRSGQRIFQSDRNKPWDGTFRGKILPIGTYYYVINPKNNVPSLSGWVAIIL